MSCPHKWERRDKQPWCLPYYICTECEMELSTSQYEAVQQACREGWEQCQMECVDIAEEHASNPSVGAVAEKIADAISAMEYGGEK